MHTFVLEKFANMYEKMDSVIITNKDGVIEYAAMFDHSDSTLKNEGYTGRNILDVYPELSEETSSHFRAIRTGRPIIDETQRLTDFNGKEFVLFSSTYPIELEGQIIGAIEGTVYLDQYGHPFRSGDETCNLLTSSEERLYRLSDIITKDEKMIEIKEQIERIAAGDSSVLIIGKTGTGKELVAQSLHTHSLRANGPFISQNCAAIPASLLESTLFGTAKGSYTGAVDRKGLFELASGGTLFLDEINSMDIGLQGKILKVLEEQKIRRIGAESETRINVRIISAMNTEPYDEIAEKRLREDLYYRLGIEINLPPLASRRKDIPELTKHFIRTFNQKTGKNISGCSEIVNKLLQNYPWPGNVRELRNTVEYAFNMARGDEITMSDIPDRLLYSRTSSDEQSAVKDWSDMLKAGTPLPAVVSKFEEKLIRDAAAKASSVTEAAKALNITRQALNYKLDKYNIKIKAT